VRRSFKAEDVAVGELLHINLPKVIGTQITIKTTQPRDSHIILE